VPWQFCNKDLYQALCYGTLSFGTANNMRNILILSVMNRKQDSCTLSDDYENKWEEKQMDKQQWNTHSCPRIHHDGIWGNGGIAPFSSQSQYKMGLSIQPHAPAALTPGKRPQ